MICSAYYMSTRSVLSSLKARAVNADCSKITVVFFTYQSRIYRCARWTGQDLVCATDAETSTVYKNRLAHKSKPGAPQVLPSARAVSAVHSSKNWSNIATN